MPGKRKTELGENGKFTGNKLTLIAHTGTNEKLFHFVRARQAWEKESSGNKLTFHDGSGGIDEHSTVKLPWLELVANFLIWSQIRII